MSGKLGLFVAGSLVCLPLVIGCGDSDAAGGGGSAPTPPAPIAFSEMGSLTSEAGKGSFRFGAATAATQIEDQNQDTDWWFFTLPEEQGGLGKGKAPVGDASMGYSMSSEDIQLLVDLGVDSYRFSIEWARVEPERDVIDEAALQHYSDQIDALIEAGIRPMITVHHFSNPTWVADPRGNALLVRGPTTSMELIGALIDHWCPYGSSSVPWR